MSPQKLKTVLAAILRDMAPWPHSKQAYRWGEPSLALSEKQIKALPPYSVFIALVTFSGYPHYGHGEKIAWSIPVKFKGVGYLISHQKFGLRRCPDFR